MIHPANTIVFLLFLFSSLQADQLWSVRFLETGNYLEQITRRFPYVDLIQSDSNLRLTYIFRVPDGDVLEFARFIHQSSGKHRIMFDDTTNINDESRTRRKRALSSDDPLDESYYQHFLSYDEQQQWYELLQNSSTTKDFVRLHTIGQTFENRTLTVVQIHPMNKDRSPRSRRRRKLAVFIDGGMHAREWLSVGVANFLLSQFLRVKETHPKVRDILRYFDLFVLPLMNPDGYEYSRKVDRLWRKNRAPTTHSDFWNGNPSCFGIDLNRNFPFKWNTVASASAQVCSHSYPGPHAASESEVRSVLKFLRMNRLSPHKFHAYFNLHAYGRFWLLPWTYTRSEKVSNYDDILKRSLQSATSAMKGTYKIGQASSLLYPCSGTSIDYAATLMPHSITFELSPIFSDLPMCYEQNKTFDETCSMGFLTGPDVIAQDGNEIFHAIVEYLHSVVKDRFLSVNASIKHP